MDSSKVPGNAPTARAGGRLGRNTFRVGGSPFSFSTKPLAQARKALTALEARTGFKFALKGLVAHAGKRMLPARGKLRVAANILDATAVVDFTPIHGNGVLIRENNAYIDLSPSESVYFTLPAIRSVRIPPHQGAFPLDPGATYVVSGAIDRLDQSEIRLFAIYFDHLQQVQTNSFRLDKGPFHFDITPPPEASKIVLAFRATGGSSFAVNELAVRKKAAEALSGPVSSRHKVVMIVLNDIIHDNRVLKTVNTLQSEGYNVSLFGLLRNRETSVKTIEIANTTAILFPDPRIFLRNTLLQADRWQHTIAYLQAVMWPIVQQIDPRFIHTHDYHTVQLGVSFTQRLRKAGRTVNWLHDVHDYLRGYDHMEPEMQELFLQYEGGAIHSMDQVLTVSPLIVEWLLREYQLTEPPTIVMNAPRKSSFPEHFERSIRDDLKLDAEAPLIVYTGGVQEMKGIHTVVGALAHGPTWHFAVVTERKGPYIDHLKSLARDGGCQDRLHFLPYVKPNEVPAYVRDASIGIIPFRRYGNGDASLPNKLFDYLHAGLPLVTSDCTHMKEFVEKWQIGQVFAAEDVMDCKRAIDDTLNSLAQYRQNIQSHAALLEECTWEEQSKHLLAAYRRMENAPGPQGAG